MKVLVYLAKNKLAPRGGPLAIGYYIFSEVQRTQTGWIEFLESGASAEKQEQFLKKYLYKFPALTKIVRSIRHIRQYNALLNHPESVKPRSFDGYDAVHFHSTVDLYAQRENLKGFQGKLLLNSHSPVPMAQELYDASATGFEKAYMDKRRDRFKEMDAWAFNRADYVVFPCPEAEEPYINNWEEYRVIRERKKDCYRYVLTGITPSEAQISRTEIRKELGVFENDFLVSYVGRHNKVKGYDKLKAIGEALLEGACDLWVVVAGSEGPLTRLEHPRWIEVGWTSDPHSYIAASDVFILPNQETYFDAVMIEVLSLGKIVVASRTGGNKYFERIGAEGVFLYDTVEEAVELIRRIKNMPVQERRRLEAGNYRLYESSLTSKTFFDSYLKLIEEIG